ncbi:helix-turn-helix transcriptional regulator [Sphingomonas sp. So64.6b]|uniref:winged helix-turn-helix transcriptional regulator n=1 Tax=Sphingomonas sp. So64.6b TaxID=2997354 RepID=UPI001602E191|nr:helix-turn-helix domain-containing protein [Sphingomonas sp. So64.6b]QNA84935.1 helix-turn-helix transcriptional regulator [Sphingomonas sp. So64.6b]
MKHDPAPSDRTLCPVARAQMIVGDRWTVIVLRELFMGNSRFEQIQAQAGTTPQMLAARLKKLEAEGLVERRPYSTRPPRHEYFLTEMGLAFHPILLALRAWGETWIKSAEEEVAIRYTHIPCGEDPGLGPECQSCGRVMRREELRASLNDGFAAERDARWADFKGR